MTPEQRDHTNCDLRQTTQEFAGELTNMAALMPTIISEAAASICRWADEAVAEAVQRDPGHLVGMAPTEGDDMYAGVERFIATVPAAVGKALSNERMWAHLDGTLRADLPDDKNPREDRYNLCLYPPQEVRRVLMVVMAPLGVVLRDAGFQAPEGYTWLKVCETTSVPMWGMGIGIGSKQLMEALGSYARSYKKAIETLKRIRSLRKRLEADDALRKLEDMKRRHGRA